MIASVRGTVTATGPDHAVVEVGGKFAALVAFPLNRFGDELGCKLNP